MGIARVVFDGLVAAIKSLFRDEPFTREQVAQKLDAAAAKKGGGLKWRTSAVDLMKTLDRDSSLQARRDLADELGYEGNFEDTAKMNLWLVEKVQAELAGHYIDMPGQAPAPR